MGDGIVLEHGTHNELLGKGGAYARLVESQKLREETEPASDSEDAEAQGQPPVPKEDMAPIGRVSTSRSLASDILQHRRTGATEHDEDYSILYLFKRMLPLARSQWRNYVLGTIFAASQCLNCIYIISSDKTLIFYVFIVSGMIYPAFGVVYANGVNGFALTNNHDRQHAGNRTALWFGFLWT